MSFFYTLYVFSIKISNFILLQLSNQQWEDIRRTAEEEGQRTAGRAFLRNIVIILIIYFLIKQFSSKK